MDRTPVSLDLLQPYLDRAAHRGRTMLLPTLHYAQSLYGWLPPEVQEATSRALRVPLADIHGVIGFGTHVLQQADGQTGDSRLQKTNARCNTGRQPDGNGVTRIDSACSTARRAATATSRTSMCRVGDASLRRWRWTQKPVGGLTPDGVVTLLAGNSRPNQLSARTGDPALKLTRVGKVDPGSLADYLRHGGFEALADAVTFRRTA